MKTTFVLIALTLFSFTNLNAQQEQLVDKLVNHTCSCLDNLDPQELGEQEFQSKFQGCITKYLMSNIAEVEKVFSSMENTDMMSAMAELGKSVGKQLLKKCPNTVSKLSGMDVEELEQLVE
jgi:hypothetical protein